MLVCALPSATAADVAPTAPQDLRATLNPDGTFSVTWTAPANAATVGVDYYTVERLGVSGWELVDETTGTGLVDESPFALAEFIVGYQVTATNSAGSATQVVFEIISSTGVGGGGGSGPPCSVITGGIGAIGVDGACVIFIVTEPMPEPARMEARNHLMPIWGTICQQLC